MKITLHIVFILSFSFSWGQNTAYAKGVVLDSVPVLESMDETFALYLPKKHKSDKPAPVVFIFDPSARGKSGLASFLTTSEKYGYILVCSNNSKNGPYDKNIEIASRLFDRIFSILNIDKEQVYLSGFSGGSRLASRIALLSEDITGIVGCGAGFSADVRFMPQNSKFLYAGICGNRDMNYAEMIGLKPFLKSLGQPFTIQTYDGNHSWPPPEEIEKAFDWITVQLHKKKKVALTVDVLEKFYKKDYTAATRNKSENNYLQALEDLERIQSTYKDIFEMDSIYQSIKDIKRSKEYKNVLKSLTKALEQEQDLTQKYVGQISLDLKKIDEKNLVWWERELSKLKKRYKTEDVEIQKMIDRLRFKIFVYLYESGNLALNTSASNPQLTYSRKIIDLLKSTSPN